MTPPFTVCKPGGWHPSASGATKRCLSKTGPAASIVSLAAKPAARVSSNISPKIEMGGLRYVSCSIDGSAPSNAPTSSRSPSWNPPMPRYRVFIIQEPKDLVTMVAWYNQRKETGRCLRGCYRMRHHRCGVRARQPEPNGWFMKNMASNKLIGVTVYYDTSMPSKSGRYQAKNRVPWLGASPEWGKYEYNDDGGDAGDGSNQPDMVVLTICPI